MATFSASSASASSASGRPPTEQARRVAVATVLAACRSGRLGLAEAEDHLSRVFAARTAGDLHQAIVGLPHPPAPLVVPGDG
ncbi:MAG: DUF1707 domain-containing protein [Acidimicrobiales bacterium]